MWENKTCMQAKVYWLVRVRFVELIPICYFSVFVCERGEYYGKLLNFLHGMTRFTCRLYLHICTYVLTFYMYLHCVLNNEKSGNG